MCECWYITKVTLGVGLDCLGKRHAGGKKQTNKHVNLDAGSAGLLEALIVWWLCSIQAYQQMSEMGLLPCLS